MNAHALLTAQGWRGTGHSLHPTSDNTGLTHHILIKRNQDGSGLGSKKDHKQEAWWLNAFDQALKGIDTKSGTMKQTLVGGALEKITARNAATKYTGIRGLYNSFVRGGVMDGSVIDPATSSLPTPPDSGEGTPLVASESEKKKREKKEQKGKTKSKGKREETKGETREETKEERRARREAKRSRKAEKEAKRLRKAKKEAQREAQRQAAEKIEKKKAKKAERQAIKEKRKATETKEERRARRDARRKRKEKKRLARTAKG